MEFSRGRMNKIFTFDLIINIIFLLHFICLSFQFQNLTNFILSFFKNYFIFYFFYEHDGIFIINQVKVTNHILA